MADTHEKRQRDRKKQLKRKEKLERKRRRKQEKLDADRPLYHTLIRGNEQLRIATDLWLGVLDLAAVSDWAPPEDASSSAYARPDGLSMTEEEARRLARVIDAFLPAISEEELPLSNSPFGEIHTDELLARRQAGEQLALDDSAMAQELLSGPPKQDVASLASFLKGGDVAIVAG